jgi:hypothetical protein
MIDQDLVFGGYIQVFMTAAAGCAEIGDMGFGMFHRRGQNVMVAMAVHALGHIFALPIQLLAMRLVLLRGIVMALPTTLAADRKTFALLVRQRVFVLMAVKTFKVDMHRVREIIRNLGIVFTGLVAFDTVLARNGCILFFGLLGGLLLKFLGDDSPEGERKQGQKKHDFPYCLL